jgi:excisionase family DNA binding protein
VTKTTTATDATDRLLKADELAERWGVNRATVYRLVQRGELPALKIGSGARTPLALRLAPDSQIRSLAALTNCATKQTRNVRRRSARTADNREYSGSDDGKRPRRSQEGTQNAVLGTITLPNPHFVVLSLERKHLFLPPERTNGTCSLPR